MKEKKTLSVLYDAIKVEGHKLTVNPSRMLSVKKLLELEKKNQQVKVERLTPLKLIKKITLTAILLDKYKQTKPMHRSIIISALTMYLDNLISTYCKMMDYYDNFDDDLPDINDGLHDKN